MAKDTEPQCKHCRREGMKLFLKGERCFTDKCSFERRPYRAGQHGQGRVKPSDYSIRLREKQKVRSLYGVLERQFRRYGDRLREEKGLTREEVRQAFRRGIRTDPVRLASRVRREDVLLFVATRDRSVPTHTGLCLWRALGCPELRLVPCGHYVAFSLQPWISSEASRVLRSRLGPP